VIVTRVLVRPVRQAAVLADRIAGGDLSARVSESGPGEIGALERSLNVMADSLEKDRTDLAASRARIVSTADESRRRIERDLHDGAQQRLVSLALELRAAQAAVPPELGELKRELSRVAEGLANALEELREIARGLHPAILAEGGLGSALRTVARRSPVAVDLDVRLEARLPEPVEVAAYFVVSETLTNAAKHAGASVVHVDVETVDRVLRLSVRDNGTGGADPSRGSGLVGLKDRVEALGGTISVQSPHGGGTAVDVELPLDDY
jgi:signal transduction histidine kinase